MFQSNEAMRNQQRCLVSHCFEKSIQHLFFGLRIQVGCGFVENQNGRSLSAARVRLPVSDAHRLKASALVHRSMCHSPSASSV